MREQTGQPARVTRRGALRRGAKLAYVVPAVLVTVEAATGCSVSGGDGQGIDWEDLRRRYGDGS